MKHFLLVLLFPLAVTAFNPVQNDRGYQVHMDLTHVVNDRIRVSLVVPVLEEDEVIYNMPKIIPGTYKIYDYGRFVHYIKAFDSKGEELSVIKLNVNQWKVENAKQLYKIEYWVSDSYGNEASKIFAPAGTAISEAAFLLNNFGYIGYLEGYKNVPFQLEVKKPSAMFGVTSLDELNRTDSLDVFKAETYFKLHDNPILYSAPDTASVEIGGVPVMIGVYSKEGHIKAAKVREALIPVFEAAASYLGGTLPAEKYTVIIYGLTMRQAFTGTGALEHHTSTVVTMPDLSADYVKMFSDSDDEMQMYRDIVAHEFFHIVTPLNIHSRQISNFDFINPQMSEHLWLYEGVTEYNSLIAQLKGGVMSLEDFMDDIHFKMRMSRNYNQNVPFTQLSKYALSFYGNQYHNVYLKGALIGLALDLKLRQLSEGEMGLINLLEDMWLTYGTDTSFLDDELFGILAKKSFPEIEEFLVRHVASTEPLPLTELLEEVGISYFEKKELENVNFGEMTLELSRKRKGLMVVDVDENNEFIKSLGVEKYDVVKEINGQKLDVHNYATTLGKVKEGLQEGDPVLIIVERESKGGETKTVKLKARAIKTLQTEIDYITINENLTDKQRTLRDLWMNN